MTDISTDEETIAAAEQFLGRVDEPADHRSSSATTTIIPRWWPFAAGLAVAMIAGVLLGRSTRSPSHPPPTRAVITKPHEIPEAVLPAPGEVRGTQGAPGARWAWPGAPLTAPDVPAGRPVSYQWQVCAGTPAQPSCDDIGGATTRSWPAPAVSHNQLIRVVAVVALSDSTSVRLGSVPVTTRAWPKGFTLTGTLPTPARSRRAAPPTPKSKPPGR